MESTTTLLHEEQCPVHEYPVSKTVMRAIQNTDPMWFGALTLGPKSVEQKRSPKEVCVLTDQTKSAAESNRIEKSGGYVFQNQTVPPPFPSGGTTFRQPLNFYRSTTCDRETPTSTFLCGFVF
ncbi:importin-7-like [Amblyomma americanum]